MAETPTAGAPKRRNWVNMLNQKKERAEASGITYYVPGEKSLEDSHANGEDKSKSEAKLATSTSSSSSLAATPAADSSRNMTSSGASLQEIKQLFESQSQQFQQQMTKLLEQHKRSMESSVPSKAAVSNELTDSITSRIDSAVKPLESVIRPVEDALKVVQKQQQLESLLAPLIEKQTAMYRELQHLHTTISALEMHNATLLERQAILERNIIQRENQNFDNINRFLVLQFVMWIFMITWFGFCYLSL